MVATCEKVSAFAMRHGKIPAMAEFGISQGIQNTKITDWYSHQFLQPVLASPLCRRIAFAMTWSNFGSGTVSHWVPLQSDPTYPGFLQFSKSKHVIFAGDPRLGR